MNFNLKLVGAYLGYRARGHNYMVKVKLTIDGTNGPMITIDIPEEYLSEYKARILEYASALAMYYRRA
jgi:hypothetical protein